MTLTKAETAEIVGPLKGAPLSVFIVLLLCGGSMTNAELQVMTRYADEPITRATRYLELRGAVQNNGKNYGWSVKQFEQLPLPFKQLADAITVKLSTGYPQDRRVDPVLSDQLSPPPPYIEGNGKSMAEGGEERRVDPVFPDQLSEQQKSFDICRQFGVGAKKATELSQLAWATPEYTEAIFATYKRRDDLSPRNRIAYAIQAITDHDAAPASQNTCADCGRVINPRLNFCAHCAVNN